MAINASFNGATIYKPGSYSKLSIDQGGAFPLGQTGIVAIIGESTKGEPGSKELDIGLNVYTADQIVEIKNKYGSGPIVDACNFLFAPASDGAIPSGAQAVYIYKTNASEQATLSLGSYGTVKAKEYGVGGNRMTYKCTASAEVVAHVDSSATFLPTALVDGDDIQIRVDGSKVYTFMVPVAEFADKAALMAGLVNIANWDDAAALDHVEIVDMIPADTINAKVSFKVKGVASGKSRTLELVGGDALVKMNLAVGFYKPATEAKVNLQLSQKRDVIIESAIVGGDILIEIGCDKAIASADVTVDAAKIILKEAGVEVASFTKEAYKTVKDLAEDISLVDGWSAVVTNELFNQLNPKALDQVVAAGALSALNKPARIKKDAYDVAEFFAESSLADITNIAKIGLPANKKETLLGGGKAGATLMTEIMSALTKFEGIRVNSIIPLFSRDASEDIADMLTDSASDYTIDAIHQAVRTHLSLTATTKNRSERQGYLSYKKSFMECQVKANQIADFRVQLFIQDTKNIDSDGTLKWFQPWSMACLVAGARSGSPVGTPMTFKYLNCSGIRHTAQAMSTDEADIVVDFNPRTQFETAIKTGITFAEAPQSGGFRVVVDNTTYGKDGNWVRNRGNVQYAADVLVYDYRTQLENIYIGVKNTINANEVKATAEAILSGYLTQGITVQSDDAPNGFKGLTVQIIGNTIKTSFVAKLVEGIDYCFSDITVSRKTSAA